MPELPEIETLKNQLADLLPGQVIDKFEILKEKSFQGDPALIEGEEITDIRRFGKLLVIDLENGLSLAVHLKMSGQLIYQGNRVKGELRNIDEDLRMLPNKHTRVIINFIDGDRLYFNDLRRFGWIKVVRKQESGIRNKGDNINSLYALTGKLGPDPFSLNNLRFHEIIHKTNKPIKLVLMDQEKIAGVGNIYANESLFMSGINPKVNALRITRIKSDELLANLKAVLMKGLEYRGSSRNNYRDAYGRKGAMQDHFLVYNRAGKNCPNNCKGKVKRMTLGGRGTFFCPKCQK